VTKRILVVEDEEDSRKILRDLLSTAPYEMTEAENGEQALAAVAKQRPDLILMDIQMPVLDGPPSNQYLAGPPQPPKRKLRPAFTTLLVSSMPKTNGVGPTKPKSRLPKS
jgi:CheY-like chemotaxis protein